jgi:hypothetical protein
MHQLHCTEGSLKGRGHIGVKRGILCPIREAEGSETGPAIWQVLHGLSSVRPDKCKYTKSD